MKLLHAADLQIGAQRKIPGYLERQRKALQELQEIAQEEQVDAILLVGDIFEHCRPAQEEIDLVLRFLDYVDDKLGIPVIILVGNHEYTQKSLQGYHALKTIQLIQHRFQHLEVLDELTVLDLDKFAVVAVPPAKTKEDELDRLSWPEQEVLNSGKPVVLLLHVTLQGSVFRGMPQDRGFDPLVLDTCGVDYIALGDIHQRQKAKCQTPAYYPGSLIQKDFGEDASLCGVLIVEGSSGSITVRPRRLKKPQILQAFDVTTAEFEQLADSIPDNCYAKVRVVGSAEELRDLKIKKVEKALERKRSKIVDLTRRVQRSLLSIDEHEEGLSTEEVQKRFQERLQRGSPAEELKGFIESATWKVDPTQLLKECSDVLARVEGRS